MPEATGRPAYHPATLLKIYLYGYLNRIQSSRRLEWEIQRNIEQIGRIYHSDSASAGTLQWTWSCYSQHPSRAMPSSGRTSTKYESARGRFGVVGVPHSDRMFAGSDLVKVVARIEILFAY